MSTPIVPLIQSQPGIYQLNQLYIPDANGNSPGLIFPCVNSLIFINTNELYYVNTVNTTALTFTYVPVELSNLTDDTGLASSVTYGNTMFRAYYDTRTNPYRCTISQNCVIYGASPRNYTLTRYPNNPTTAVVISQYYDSTGTYQGSAIPMTQVQNGGNVWTPNPCIITQQLVDDEELLLQVFNETGAVVAEVMLFAKQSIIINDAYVVRPRIVSIAPTSVQMLSNGSCYVFEKQSLSSLNIQAVLTYEDGSTRTVEIDNQQCFMYGQEDFLASYAGLQQQLTLKYFLSSTEAVSATNPSTSSVSCTFNVQVVSNNLAVPLKISVLPIWSASSSQYVLRYYYYTTAKTAAIDVTAFVSIVTGSFSGNNYIAQQSFVLQLDMHNVDPTTYPASTMYQQNCTIKLQPYAALVRYIIQDAVSSPYVYGQDSSASRRPVLYYDSTLNQYFIPSSIFQNLPAVLLSFFTNANPPYDNTVESSAPTPTHFLVRDPFQSSMISASLIPLTTYNQAFTIINGTNGAYVGSTVIVEFIQQTAGGTPSVVYGVPVDVYAGSYQG